MASAGMKDDSIVRKGCAKSPQILLVEREVHGLVADKVEDRNFAWIDSHSFFPDATAEFTAFAPSDGTVTEVDPASALPGPAEIDFRARKCHYTGIARRHRYGPHPEKASIIEKQFSITAPGANLVIWWSVFGLLVVVLLVPLFLTEMPPLLDYPNHLARMEILARLPGDTALAKIYAVDWRIVPNIGIDVAMPALMHVLSLMAAGKVFVGLALILPLLGVIALHRAMFGSLGYWPLAAGLVAYNRLFFAGFLNFLIGVGLALLGAALWRILQERSDWLRVATAAIAAVVIFFCHLIAVAFYGLLLLGMELARARETRRRSDWRPLFGRLMLLAVPFVIPAVLYLRAPISTDAPAGGHGLTDALKHYYWALAASYRGLKLYGLMGPFLTYDRVLDAGAAVMVVAVLASFVAGRRLRIAPALAGVFLLLLIAYPVVPFFLMQTAWVDQRLPILAGFLLFAGTWPLVGSRRTVRLMAAAFGAALLARTAVIGLDWAGHDAQIADFRSVIAPVQAGDRVLVVQTERNDDPAAMVNKPDSVRAMVVNDATMHLPALLIIEHQAFWPLLFTAATKQPVRVIPPYDAISLPEGELPWAGGLAGPDPATVKWAPYLPGWEKKFDWVLVLHPGAMQGGYELLPDRLEPAQAGSVAVLYRIRK